MARKATINAVAARAGVSRGTVDRVLNQRPNVKLETYERVVRAMRELKYIPPHESQSIALGLDEPAPEALKLGVLLPNWGGYFKTEVMRGINDARSLLEEFQIAVLLEECETEMPDESVERLNSLLEKGVQGVALCAKDHKNIVQLVDSLYDQGIPVITFNSDLTNCRRLYYVGQDLVKSGRVAAELISKCLLPDDKLLIAIGNHEFYAHRMRLQGFCERLSEIGISEDQYVTIETYNDYALTHQKVGQMIRQIPTIRGIYMANHSVTGCVQAIRDTGKSGAIRVISHDLTNSSRLLLEAREIDFVIGQDIYAQGYRPLLMLRDYLQNNILPQNLPDQETIEIICSENL